MNEVVYIALSHASNAKRGPASKTRNVRNGALVLLLDQFLLLGRALNV